jgi:PIN domain nuclease of toxin-antitoxin system
MRLLLDTQAFFYAVLGAVEKFPTRAAKAVGDGTSEFFISVISLFELEVLIRKGRFNTTPAKIEAGLKLLDAKVLPFATRHDADLHSAGTSSGSLRSNDYLDGSRRRHARGRRRRTIS